MSKNRDNDDRSSLVEPFRTQEDIMNIQNYFLNEGKYLMFLIFEIGISTGRRIGDILDLEWNYFYYNDGKKRRKLKAIKEQKTDKFSSPYLSEAVWKAIEIYRSKTGCVVSENDYNNKIALQLSGTHKGSVVTKDGCLKALKKAAENVGIKYNVGNHSLRKTFGYMVYNMYSNDPQRMELLQAIFNHSDTSITRKYIGLTDDSAAKYYDGIGDMLCSIMNGETISLLQKATNNICVDYDKIDKIMFECIIWGQKNPTAGAEEIFNYRESVRKTLREISVI